MHQLTFFRLSRFRVQPGHLLPAGMEITTYNDHYEAPSSPASLVLQPKRLHGSKLEPSLLSNQFKPSFGLGGVVLTAEVTGQRRASKPESYVQSDTRPSPRKGGSAKNGAPAA